MVFGLTVKFFILGQENFTSRLKQIPRAIEDSALIFGAKHFRILKDIHLPLMTRTSVVIFVLVFVETAKEMPITLIARNFGTDTLATKIYEYTSDGQFEYAAAPNLISFSTWSVGIL